MTSTSRGLRHAVLWITLTAICISAVWITVQRRQMMDSPLSQRLSEYAIPTAISTLRGLRDYSSYMEIASFFVHRKEQPIANNISSALLTSIQLPASRLFFSGDDKGIADLVYFSFALFGPYVASIYLGIAVLGTGSLLLYVAEFYKSPQRMALLIALLASFYVILFTFGMNDQSSNILEPRFIGFLGIIPLLHVVLIALGERDPSLGSIARTNLQILLLLFVAHLRSSEFWQVACVVLVCLGALYFRRNWRVSVGILAVVSSLLFAGSWYRNHTYNREYRTTDIATRVLWHNAITGLAVNQNIRERYSLNTLDDGATTEAVRTFLKNTGQTDVLNAIFTRPDYSYGNFFGFNWSAYEVKAREFYFHVFRDMPLDVLLTYTVTMPKVFVSNLSHMSGYALFPKHLWPTGNWKTFEQRTPEQQFLNPFQPFALAIFAIMVLALVTASPKKIDLDAVVAIGVVFICSTIPPLLATAAFQYIQLSTLLLLGGTYFVVGATIAIALRRALRKHFD